MTRVLVNLIDFIISHLYIEQNSGNVKKVHDVVLKLQVAKDALEEIYV